jgi:hypothetical protein
MSYFRCNIYIYLYISLPSSISLCRMSASFSGCGAKWVPQTSPLNAASGRGPKLEPKVRKCVYRPSCIAIHGKSCCLGRAKNTHRRILQSRAHVILNPPFPRKQRQTDRQTAWLSGWLVGWPCRSVGRVDIVESRSRAAKHPSSSSSSPSYQSYSTPSSKFTTLSFS